MNSPDNRKIHGYKCQNPKCRFIAYAAEFVGLRCPQCGGDSLQPACCAKNRRKTLCGKHPYSDNGRCELHGGKTPAPGPTHPNYKHGRLSKYLPPAVAQRLAEVKADPDFLSIRENAEIVATRKSQLAERLSTGESGETWKLLRKLWGEFKLQNRLAVEAGDDAELRSAARQAAATALDQCGRLIENGASDENRWDEFLAINQDEAGMIAMETARQHRMAEMMTMEQAGVLVLQVTEAVMQVVKDQQQRMEIGRLLHAILQTGQAPAAREVAPAILIEAKDEQAEAKTNPPPPAETAEASKEAGDGDPQLPAPTK